MDVNSVVRAIDLGFGNVKYVTGHQHGQPVRCDLFPSLAAQVVRREDLGGGVMAQRDTVVIEVDGAMYEVGKDAELATDTTHGRTLDGSYPVTAQYLAMMRGALAYMGQPVIDLLVLGLPNNTISQYEAKLKEIGVGEHVVPNIRRRVDSSAPAEITVTVREVWVLNQPLGGFFDHAITAGTMRSMSAQQNLIIDPGFFTFDWLMAKGFKPITSRSKAVNGGMSAVLRVIADAISQELVIQPPNLKRVDDAVRNGGKMRLFGRDVDISAHIRLGKSKAAEYIAELASLVGDGSDVDNIILAGGGSQFFLDVVEAKYPRHKIIIANDPIYANVRGFQMAGEERVRKAQFAAGRAAA